MNGNKEYGVLPCSYLVEQQVQRAIAHVFCDDAEELGFVADAQDLDDVVESGFVEHLCLLQQTVPLSETQCGKDQLQQERKNRKHQFHSGSSAVWERERRKGICKVNSQQHQRHQL